MKLLDSVQEQGVTEFLFDVHKVQLMLASGAFADREDFELVDGRLIVAPSEGPSHQDGASKVLEALYRRFFAAEVEGRYRIASPGTVRLSDRRLLSPDLLVVRSLDSERLPEAHEAVLVVEVAVSSISYDEGLKRRMYAEAGVAELWIVEPERRRVLVCRRPTPEGYADVVELGPEGLLSPPFAPDRTIAVSEIVL